MTNAVSHSAYQPTFVTAHVSAAVRDVITRIVRANPHVTEAHLVTRQRSATGRGVLTLVLVSAEQDTAATLDRELRAVLQPQVRPKIIGLSTIDPDLPWIRGLDGELKRETAPVPWWMLLFFGI